MTGRGLRILIHALGMVVGLAVLALLGIAWRLAEGPVSLGPAASYLEEAINDSDLGIAVRFGDVVLSGGDWRRTFNLELSNVLIFDQDDRVTFAAREIGLDVSLAALLRAELRPVGLVLEGPKIDLVRDETGEIGITLADSLNDDASGSGSLSGDRSLLERIEQAAALPPFDRLVHVEFRNADITFDDRMLDLHWQAPNSSMSMIRDDAGILLHLATVLRSGAQTLPLELVGTHRHDLPGIDITARLTDVPVPSLAGLLPSPPDLSGMSFTVDGDFGLSFDGDLALSQGTFHLESAGGRVDWPGTFEHPFDLGPTSLSGTLGPQWGSLEVTAIHPGIARGSLEGSLHVAGWTNDAPIAWTIAARGLPVDDLGRYWPESAAPRVRDWIVTHLSGGTIDEASLGFGSTLGELDAGDPAMAGLDVALEASGVTVEFLESMPPVEGVAGRLRIDGDSLEIETRGGTLSGLVTRAGFVSMDGFDRAMSIRAALEGPLAAALSVAAHEPLSWRLPPEIAPDSVEGTLDGAVEITIADLAAVDADAVRYRFDAAIEDLALAIAGYRLDGGSGRLGLDGDGRLSFEGAAALNGVPLSLAYGASGGREVLGLSGRVDETGLEALGIDDPVGLTGAIAASLTRTAAAGDVTWEVEADLQEAAFSIPSLGASKAPGEAGSLRLAADERGGGLVIRTLDASGGNVAVRASGTIGGDTLALDVQKFAAGRTDLKGTLAAAAGGGYALVLKGGSLDMAAPADDGAQDDALPPLAVAGALDRLWTPRGVPIDNLTIEGTYADGRFESLLATGELEGGSRVDLGITRVAPDERRFEFEAANLGDFIRAFADRDNIEGGTLKVEGWFDERQTPAAVIGSMQADRFTVRDAPAAAHLFTLASLPGLASVLADRGLVLNAAFFPFRKEGDLISVGDSRLYGQGFRILMNGEIDTGPDVVHLSGTLVPDNILNEILDGVPLIGDILTGPEEDGGIFAFIFEVDGPVDDPGVVVNPLSVLTPGIFRQLFTDQQD